MAAWSQKFILWQNEEMNLDDLLIPARHIDIFYAVIAQNGGIRELEYKDDIRLSKEAFVEVVVRLGGRYDGELKPAVAPTVAPPSPENEKNEVHFRKQVTKNELQANSFKKNESINEEIPKNEQVEAPKNETMKQASLFIDDTIDNQIDEMGLPKVIVQDWRQGDKNLIKAIFDYKDAPLKDVADRYGGSSASANLANFMAKTDVELSKMRKSTAERLAKAMEVPVEWILVIRNK